MNEIVRLSQALSARICHDLAGSIGAISNCLELVENDDVAIRSDAMNLAVSQSRRLVSTLNFFRTAYGGYQTDKDISVIQLNKLLQDYLHQQNIALNFHFEEGMIMVPSYVGKMILCIVIISCEVIRQDGVVTLSLNSKDGKVSFKLNISGANILTDKITNGELFTIDFSRENFDAKNCREAYVRAIAESEGMELLPSSAENSLVFFARAV